MGNDIPVSSGGAIINEQYSNTTLTSTAATLGELTNIEWVNNVVFKISGLATETVSISGLVDATVYTASTIRPIDLATGALTAASALGNGSYQLNNFALKSLKFTKSATTDPAVVTVFVKG